MVWDVLCSTPAPLLVALRDERTLPEDRVQPPFRTESGHCLLSRGLAHVELSGDVHGARESLASRVLPSVKSLPQFGRYLGPDGNGAIKVHNLSFRAYAGMGYRGSAVVRLRDSA